MNKRQVAMLIGLVIAAGFALTNFYLTYNWLRSSSDPGWIEAHANDRTIVLRVNKDGPASMLRYGDELVSINGTPVDGRFSTYRFLEGAKPGTEYTLRINRNEQSSSLRLTTSDFPSLFSCGVILSTAVVPASFVLFALLLILFSEGKKEILLLAAALALTVPEIPLFTLATAPFWAKIIMVMGRPLSLLAFPLYFRFILTFPEESPLLKKFRFLNRRFYLYGPYLILGFCGSIFLSMLAVFAPDQVFPLRSGPIGYLARYGVILVYVPAILLSLAWALKRANQRTMGRVRIIAKGIFWGFGLTVVRSLFLSVLLFLPLEWQSWVPVWFLNLLIILAFGSLAFMPMFFTYAIARRQLIPINTAMRRAAEYTATYVVFSLIYFLLTVLLSYLLVGLLITIDVPLIWAGVVFVPLLTIPLWTFSKLFNNKVIVPHVKLRSAQLSYDLREAWPDLLVQLRNVIKTAKFRLPITRVDQTAIAEFRRALRETLDIKQIAASVSKLVLRTWVADNIAILLEERSSGDYVCAAYESLANLKMSQGEMMQLRLSGKARVVREMQSTQNLLSDPGGWLRSWAISKDLGPESSLAELQTIRRLRPAVFIPILVEDQMLGILSLGQRSEELGYNNQDRETLLRIARETGEAIGFARLKIIAASPDLPLVLENVIKSTAVPAQKGSIYLWNEEEQALVINAQYGFNDGMIREVRLPRGKGFAGLVFDDQKPLVVDDVQLDHRGMDVGKYQIAGIQSSIILPLVAWGRSIGVICLDNMEKKSAFKRQHLDILIGVTSFVSIVVQNAILQEELRSLGSRINRSHLTVSEIFALVFNSIRRVTDVRASHLVLVLDPYMPELSVKEAPILSLAQGFNDKDKYGQKIKLGKNGLGYRVLQQKEAVIGDSLEDWVGSGSEREAPQTKACICLPLDITKYVGGLLYLHYCSEHEFTHAEVITLRFFAEQAALAISNARQQEELRYTNKVVWMSLMISNIRHEIRQYTDGIRTNLHGLGNRVKGAEADYLMRINADLDEIRDLQARSLPTVSEKKVVEIRQFVCQEVQRWSEPQCLDCSAMEKRNCYVHIDVNQFGLVLKNLTTNAVRAMSTTGTKRLTISSEIVGHRIKVQMSNTGKQMSRELQEKLFNDVINNDGSNSQRTGIGLFIGRRIVRFHGGDLVLLKSDENETIFSFWLPTIEARSKELAKELIGNGKI